VRRPEALAAENRHGSPAELVPMIPCWYLVELIFLGVHTWNRGTWRPPFVTFASSVATCNQRRRRCAPRVRCDFKDPLLLCLCSKPGGVDELPTELDDAKRRCFKASLEWLTETSVNGKQEGAMRLGYADTDVSSR
jgi:hypothetical protein